MLSESLMSEFEQVCKLLMINLQNVFLEGLLHIIISHSLVDLVLLIDF